MGAPPSKILPGLYLGGRDVLSSEQWFRDHEVTHVLSVCQETPPEEFGLEVLHIDEYDMPKTNLRQYMRRIALFVHGARAGGGTVYIHCAAGVSRSTTSTLAYLVASLDVPLRAAVDFVVAKRPCTCPNPGFMKQLHKFEAAEAADVRRELRAAYSPADEALRERDVYAIAYDVESFAEARGIDASARPSEADDGSDGVQQAQAQRLQEQLAGQEDRAGGDLGLAWLKPVAVRVAARGEEREVTVDGAAKARDVLRAAGWPDEPGPLVLPSGALLGGDITLADMGVEAGWVLSVGPDL